MPHSTRLDRVAVAAILRAQEQVISRRQALACGMTPDGLSHRSRPDGPWQRLLPGIYLAQTGPPGTAQREMAALLHAGPASVLTGPAALRCFGMQVPEPCRLDVLVPATRRPGSVAFVTIHRTTRMPERVIVEGRRYYALPPRALADTARGLTDLREVRALIVGAIQNGDCPLEALKGELSEGQIRHSALLRGVLAEAADGIRSVVEAEFRDLIGRAGLPMPMFNPDLFTSEGTFIARPDAFWPQAGVVAEIDSQEWHLKPSDWERTARRHATMSSHGILVLHFTPRQIRKDEAAVVGMLSDTLRSGRAKPLLRIRARPAVRPRAQR